jgi:hypothetical protein
MNNEITTLISTNGTELVQISEIGHTTKNQYPLDESNPTVNRIANLTSDIFKGVISLPNKTVEVVFKPEIQRGLDESTYKFMLTKEGEKLADALNASTGKIVGKGRIVETGKTKQLLGGAFQLVSIAVAQAHLADINNSLNRIQASLDKVLEKFETIARSEIRGAIVYLHELVEFLKLQDSPENLPSAKRMKIEDINYDFKKWREAVFSEMKSVLNKIDNQKDIDTFGTGDTYIALKSHIETIDTLNDRYQLLLELANMFNFIAIYLDPQHKQFSRVEPKVTEWIKMVEEAEQLSRRKAVELIKSAIFNQDETLVLRQRDITSIAEKQKIYISIQQKNYHEQANRLSHHLDQLMSPQGEIRLAITFDSAGATKHVAMLPS